MEGWQGMGDVPSLLHSYQWQHVQDILGSAFPGAGRQADVPRTSHHLLCLQNPRCTVTQCRVEKSPLPFSMSKPPNLINSLFICIPNGYTGKENPADQGMVSQHTGWASV